MGMCLDSLMVRALDEPDALYGLLAQIDDSVSDDRNSFDMQIAARSALS